MHVVPLVRQVLAQVRQVLARGGDVRPVVLVDEQEPRRPRAPVAVLSVRYVGGRIRDAVAGLNLRRRCHSILKLRGGVEHRYGAYDRAYYACANIAPNPIKKDSCYLMFFYLRNDHPICNASPVTGVDFH